MPSLKAADQIWDQRLILVCYIKPKKYFKRISGTMAHFKLLLREIYSIVFHMTSSLNLVHRTNLSSFWSSDARKSIGHTTRSLHVILQTPTKNLWLTDKLFWKAFFHFFHVFWDSFLNKPKIRPQRCML